MLVTDIRHRKVQVFLGDLRPNAKVLHHESALE
jgi:hypothetical protein